MGDAGSPTSACPASGLPSSTEGFCPIAHTNAHDDGPQSRAIGGTQPQDSDFDPSVLLPIPKPPHHAYFGLLGHAPDLDSTLPVKSYWKLMDQYAPIYQLDLNMTHPRVFVGDRELVNEMADDSRFIKFTHRLHQEMRPVFGDGLFSAESTDPAWWKAHRLLVPAFGPVGLSKMFDDMQDISAQLVGKWDRFGPGHHIECIEDMAKLTFDTIGLCAFGYRFNQFYSADPHPFERQLKESIVESGKRANRPDLLNLAYYKDEAHRQENIVKMRALCRSIIQDRLEHPKPNAKDLLNIMLHGVDKETGEQMGIENVIYQIPTLLGGGYETTGSTLCFIYYYLCKYPEAMRKAQQEVDEVVGDKVLTYDMLRDLKYLDAAMKEALRMQHPVSLLTRFAVKDTVLGGKYLIKQGQMVSGIWKHFHRDPKVWGEDADEFRPERMLDKEFSQVPPNSWKPFGDGLRACIGRGFAEQEIIIHIAMALQKFDVSLVDSTYDLQLRGQMGVKPIDFKIKVKRREGRDINYGMPGGNQITQSENSNTRTQEQKQQRNDLKPASVFWGGNMGTCESLVQSFVRSAPDLGLDVVECKELDDCIDKLPTGRSSIIVIPSYEGRPPDNGRKFCAWLEKSASQGKYLPSGVKFAVFGVGNSDWTHTFHKVPKMVNEVLEKLGAERIIEAGFANVKREPAVGPWEDWTEKFCATIRGENERTRVEQSGVDVEIEVSSHNHVQKLPESLGGEQLGNGLITENRELAEAGIGYSKRHVEVRLPAGSQYRSGDYLVVQAQNPVESVRRVLKRFNLGAEDMMRVVSSKKDFLPCRPVAVEYFLRRSVELATPINARQLATLVSWTTEGSKEQSKLRLLQEDVAYEELVDKRYSILDVLDEVPTLQLPFGVYIDLLQPLAPRIYSIASSPEDPSSKTADGGLIAAVTFDVFEGPATSGHGTFRGVASSYLASRAVGDSVACLVRPSRAEFHLPVNQQTPIMMLAGGSGIAPMRAFLQERAVLQSKGSILGPALLFFGCRYTDQDYLYREELEAWAADGIVDLIPCFSRPGGDAKGRYVGDALWERRDEAWRLFQEQGAHVYVCGSAARLGRTVSSTWMDIFQHQTGKGEAAARDWLDLMKSSKGRYLSDVY